MFELGQVLIKSTKLAGMLAVLMKFLITHFNIILIEIVILEMLKEFPSAKETSTAEQAFVLQVLHECQILCVDQSAHDNEVKRFCIRSCRS